MTITKKRTHLLLLFLIEATLLFPYNSARGEKPTWQVGREYLALQKLVYYSFWAGIDITPGMKLKPTWIQPYHETPAEMLKDLLRGRFYTAEVDIWYANGRFMGNYSYIGCDSRPEDGKAFGKVGGVLELEKPEYVRRIK